MPINSKRKGSVGERELSAELRRIGFLGARRGQQYSGSPESPDIKGAIEGVHIECKRVEKLNVDKAMDQACEDAGDDVPCVMHRRNRKAWMVTVRLDDVEEFARCWIVGKMSDFEKEILDKIERECND